MALMNQFADGFAQHGIAFSTDIQVMEDPQ